MAVQDVELDEDPREALLKYDKVSEDNTYCQKFRKNVHKL